MTVSRDSAWTLAIAGLALATIWLLTHRYHGLRHDSLFYAGQALARIDPEAFRHDLFFAFGSQDDFSLFSRPYAALTDRIGLGHATLLLLLLAHLAWALAAASLARQWLGGAALWIALAIVFGLPRAYGAQGELPQGLFHYAENFLTARSWAEPFVLAAVAARLNDRRMLAYFCTLLAFACHPIMALPGLLFLAFFDIPLNRRRIASISTMVTVLAFALPTMDAEWLAIVLRRAPYVLLDRWTISELLEPITWIAILATAAHLSHSALRRTFTALSRTGLACLFLAGLGTITHAALLIQMQPWRGLWLMKVSALLALVTMFVARWHRSPADRWLLAGLVAAAATANTLGGPVALILTVLARAGWRNELAPQMPKWAPTAGGIALATVLLETLLALAQQLSLLLPRIPGMGETGARFLASDLAAFLNGPLALLLPLAMWLLLRLATHRQALSLFLAASMFTVSASGWDRDADPFGTRSSNAKLSIPFAGHIPHGSTVYWQNDFRSAWFLLRTGNYGSTHQSAGVVFSRQTALESQRRLDRLARFGATDGEVMPGPRPAQHPARAPTLDGLAQLCTDPILDFVILGRQLDGTAPLRWIDPVTMLAWHLYRCDLVRAAER